MRLLRRITGSFRDEHFVVDMRRHIRLEQLHRHHIAADRFLRLVQSDDTKTLWPRLRERQRDGAADIEVLALRFVGLHGNLVG
ncbi:MAG TPA: hypothetical protein VGI70_00810, partial [Polyangiales bacterium]